MRSYHDLPLVEILLATRNGSEYLEAQIESVFQQSYPHWCILAHDDGSVDSTVDILLGFARKHPDKFRVIQDGLVTGSAARNFNHLLAHSTANYVMFCDQDDFWFPDKVGLSINRCLELELEYGSSLPLAIFSDLCVADCNLRLINSSLFAHQKTSPSLAYDAISLSIRNCVTGCTLLLNRSAVKCAYPVPSSSLMHDWWCGLRVLSSGGRLVCLEYPTILYRQHGGNSVGARIPTIRNVLRLSYLYDLFRKFRQARMAGVSVGIIKFVYLTLKYGFRQVIFFRRG